MKLGVYCIRDRKTGFMSPNVDMNNVSAIRNFEHACMRDDSLFYSHPEDYELYKLGEFDTDSGVITASVEQPEFLVSASTIRL